MDYTPSLEKKYFEEIIPALKKEFNYKSIMQVPRLKKIIINQGIGQAVADKKLIDTGVEEISAIAGQRAVKTIATKDISNFKLRKKMPIGVTVTLRGDRMYEFFERLICVALPRIRDFRGLSYKLDGRGNYTLGISEQIIFPEIDIDKINKIMGLQVTLVTSAKTDKEGFALLREFGLPFKTIKSN
jgi:large subunit ribosomal protein L5